MAVACVLGFSIILGLGPKLFPSPKPDQTAPSLPKTSPDLSRPIPLLYTNPSYDR